MSHTVKMLLGAAAIAAAPTISSAASLDFSAGSFDAVNDVLTFSNVAAGTDLVVSTIGGTSWASNNDARNGTANGDDGRINVATGTMADLRFSFINRDTGGAATLADIDLAFFDLDFAGQEKLTLRTAASTITRVDTALGVSTEPGSVTLTGASDVNVANVTDSSSLTEDQEKAAVIFSFDSVSSFDLSFDAGGALGSGRNFIFDDDFAFTTDTTTIDFPAPVPLPAAGFLLIGGLGALAVARRRS
ncbi:VPLPA-CTERM sorting domain-containing protein [Actibacterium sp. 188UL27-1]|uniref:VPLPA-CTERM sorting domain-containing protein n=1 Tax=Actibacterium sp. 188UL27-1 TaxID=2786961 RepID=UPI001EF6E6C5|nr:VPLPA-CTERM sorting domain-containing protein [Actibacterium sp. 188UL27-1]